VRALRRFNRSASSVRPQRRYVAATSSNAKGAISESRQATGAARPVRSLCSTSHQARNAGASEAGAPRICAARSIRALRSPGRRSSASGHGPGGRDQTKRQSRLELCHDLDGARPCRAALLAHRDATEHQFLLAATSRSRNTADGQTGVPISVLTNCRQPINSRIDPHAAGRAITRPAGLGQPKKEESQASKRHDLDGFHFQFLRWVTASVELSPGYRSGRRGACLLVGGSGGRCKQGQAGQSESPRAHVAIFCTKPGGRSGSSWRQPQPQQARS
jgi:hypothetical protein